MRLRAGLALLILAACAAASMAQGAAIFSHASDLPSLSNRCVILLPPETAGEGGAAYRFGGSSTWLPFDLPLELDAAYGEDRSYALELR